MAKIDKYLKFAVSQRASDLHFSAGEPVRARIDGDLNPIEQNAQDSRAIQDLLFEIMSEAERHKFVEHKNVDKSYSLEGVGNFRVNVFMARRGVCAVLRTIPSKIPTLEELGLPEVVRNLTSLDKGLVLVTGPTGSGKSTTLAAMLNHINEYEKLHILTAEDPIEFIHPCKMSLVNQREIGSNCQTFSDALKYALREDPDVILVGEMRDLETIGLALTAAETGHLVFGTLHTRGAGASIDRIIDSFPGNQQAMIRTMLSESLAAVISQALLKRASGKGRIAAYEIMVVNHAISNLIREGKSFQIRSIMQTSRKDGMVLMDQYIKDLVDQKIVSVDQAEAYMEDPSIIGIKKGNVAASTATKVGGGNFGAGASAPTPVAKPTAPGRPSSGPPPMKAPAMPPPVKKVSAPPTFSPLEIGENTQVELRLKLKPPTAANIASHKVGAAAKPAAAAPKAMGGDDMGDLDELEVAAVIDEPETPGVSEIDAGMEVNLDDLSVPDQAYATRVTDRETGTMDIPAMPAIHKPAAGAKKPGALPNPPAAAAVQKKKAG